MSVFGFCNNKCKHEVYTKEEINNSLAECKLKGDFAVLIGEISLTEGSGNVAFDYPEGFSKENCVPVSVGSIYTTSGIYGFGFVQSTMGVGLIMNDTKISLRVNPVSGTGATGTFECKVVLMKI